MYKEIATDEKPRGGIGGIKYLLTSDTISDVNQFGDVLEIRESMMDLLLVAMIFEYGFAIVCLICGIHGFFKTAQMIQALFATIEIAVELRLYKKFGQPLGNQTLQRVCGINVSRLGIPLWLWYLITFAPNYVQVQASSALAGSMFTAWASSAFDEARAQFATNWNRVFIVGSLIGELGIPILVTAILTFSACFHIGFALVIRSFNVAALKSPNNRLMWDLSECCDLANLQFLSSCFRANVDVGFLIYGRLWAVLCVKMPLLLLKISWWSVAFCYIIAHRESITTAWALATGWYSVLQLLPAFAFSAINPAADIRDRFCSFLPFVILVLLVLHQVAHMGGVLLCPSHDISILRLGCSPPQNNTHLTCS